MKSWKRAALVLLSVFMLGCMTACSGENRVNDATNGSNTGNTLEEDINNGADALEDGAEDLKMVSKTVPGISKMAWKMRWMETAEQIWTDKRAFLALLSAIMEEIFGLTEERNLC